MKLWSESFEDGGVIPPRLAFGKAHAETHVELSDNCNPHLAWSDLPAGTRSLALVCVDPDAPSRPDNVNREGVTVPADLPRADFYHWALVDLAPDASPSQRASSARGSHPEGSRAPRDREAPARA